MAVCLHHEPRRCTRNRAWNFLRERRRQSPSQRQGIDIRGLDRVANLEIASKAGAISSARCCRKVTLKSFLYVPTEQAPIPPPS
jgi:hypothetical protein